MLDTPLNTMPDFGKPPKEASDYLKTVKPKMKRIRVLKPEQNNS